MQIHSTELGELRIGKTDGLYLALSEMMRQAVIASAYPPAVGLTGGSSPKAYFEWLQANPGALPEVRDRIVFSVSDERCVPLSSEQSNYGNAERLLFDPLGVVMDHRFPWDTSRPPEEAADWYQKLWSLSYGEDHAYNLCMLGMGDDCHTASLFPGSPLLSQAAGDRNLFAAVKVPEKGDRLTVTPYGLERCERIVILVTGAGKKAALQRAFSGRHASIVEIPIRIMARFPSKVVWLVDEAAAEGLTF
jgi:6-phosphogluconolactonase